MAAVSKSQGVGFEGAVFTALVGTTHTREYSLAADARPMRIRVGASPLCTWQITAEGVTPEHFDLVWDGQHLTVEPLPTPLPIIVNGQPVRVPTRVGLDTNIEFGSGMLGIGTLSPFRAEVTGAQRKKATVAERPSLQKISTGLRAPDVATRRMFSFARELAVAAGQRMTKTLELDVFRSQEDISMLAEKPRLGKSGTPSLPPTPDSAEGPRVAPQQTPGEGDRVKEPRGRNSARARGPVQRVLIGLGVLLVLGSATFVVRKHGLLPIAIQHVPQLKADAQQLASNLLDGLRRPPPPAPPSASPTAPVAPTVTTLKPPAVSLATPQAGDKEAAALLFMGRLEDARTAYQTLARQHPHAVYDTIVSVLEQTLAERCRSLSPAERSPQCAK